MRTCLGGVFSPAGGDSSHGLVFWRGPFRAIGGASIRSLHFLPEREGTVVSSISPSRAVTPSLAVPRTAAPPTERERQRARYQDAPLGDLPETPQPRCSRSRKRARRPLLDL